jgi:hypothetical protein
MATGNAAERALAEGVEVVVLPCCPLYGLPGGASGAEVGHHPTFWPPQHPHVRVATVQPIAGRQTALLHPRSTLLPRAGSTGPR